MSNWQPEWVTLVGFDGTEHQHAFIVAHNEDNTVNLWVFYESPLDDNPNTAKQGLMYLQGVQQAESMPDFPSYKRQHERVYYKPKP